MKSFVKNLIPKQIKMIILHFTIQIKSQQILQVIRVDN